MTVAFQGVAGAYSEIAALERFGPKASPVGFATFEAAARAAASGAARAAVIPVSNSATGAVDGGAAAVALGVALGLVRDGDVSLPVRHALLALPGVALADVRCVASHPQALAQTAGWRAAHLPHARAAPHADTAGAARDLAASGWRDAAAVAHADAAALYGLAVLADDIADLPDNATTFAVLVRRG